MTSYTLRPDIFTLNFNFTLSGNAQLYNGLIAPLVNTTIKGWLW
jgi:hypothetical protein